LFKAFNSVPNLEDKSLKQQLGGRLGRPKALAYVDSNIPDAASVDLLMKKKGK
jgi:hypothetical protein